MRLYIHPAAFLGAAALLCGLWLWQRPLGPTIEPTSAPRARVARVQRRSIELDASTLERYVGKYEGRAGFALELSMKGDRLVAQSPGMVAFQLLPTSDTEFFLKESPDVDVTFRVDERGNVAGFDADTPYGLVSVDRVP